MNVHRPIMPIIHERHLKSRHLRKIKYVSTPRALFFFELFHSGNHFVSNDFPHLQKKNND